MLLKKPLCLALFLCAFVAHAQLASSPDPQPGTVSGTVTDSDSAAIPGASVTIAELSTFTAVTADAGADFSLTGVPAAMPLHVLITAKGFATWTSPEFTLRPGEHFVLDAIKLVPGAVVTSVEAITEHQLAVEEVKEEETQRILGVIPNFYVSYDQNFAPLSARLKFQLAARSVFEPVNFVAAAFLAGLNQAADTPSYVQGAKGYGQRLGAAYADGATDIFIGGAILPALLHQDPRYFYKGTGTKKARFAHAISAPFVAKNDEGKNEFNYSSVGGDLASAAITNIYIPPYSRSFGNTFSSAAITTGGRMVNTVLQEFLFHRITKAKADPNLALK